MPDKIKCKKKMLNVKCVAIYVAAPPFLSYLLFFFRIVYQMAIDFSLLNLFYFVLNGIQSLFLIY